jgi:hypothetical protein
VWEVLVQAKCKRFTDELWEIQVNIVPTKLSFFENIRRRFVAIGGHFYILKKYLKVVVGFRNFGNYFLGNGGDV